MKKESPSRQTMLTLASTPSACQTTARRCDCIQSRSSLPDPRGRWKRPAPMPLCLQTAVGPAALSMASATATAPTPAARPNDFPSFHQAASRADKANSESRTTTAHQVPGADSSGKMPNPPAREPRIAPTVFQAKAVPTCLPRSFSPWPRSPINIGNCKPLTSAAGKTTIMAISDQLNTSPKKPLVFASWNRPASSASSSPRAKATAMAAASRPQLTANPQTVGRRRRKRRLYAAPPRPMPSRATVRISPKVKVVPPRIGPNMRYQTISMRKKAKPTIPAAR